jgi:hypothetical protein
MKSAGASRTAAHLFVVPPQSRHDFAAMFLLAPRPTSRVLDYGFLELGGGAARRQVFRRRMTQRNVPGQVATNGCLSFFTCTPRRRAGQSNKVVIAFSKKMRDYFTSGSGCARCSASSESLAICQVEHVSRGK